MDFENMINLKVPIDKYPKSNEYSDFITPKFFSRTSRHTLKPTIHKEMSEQNLNQRFAFSPTDLGLNNQLKFSNVAINRRYDSDFEWYARLITPAKFVPRKRDNSVMEKLNKMNLNKIRAEDNLSAKQNNLPRIVGFTKKAKVQANTLLTCSSLSNYYILATPLKFKRSHSYISMNLFRKEVEEIKILNNFPNKENWTTSSISDIDVQLRETHLNKERDILNRELNMLAKEMINLGIEVSDKLIMGELERILKQLKFDKDFIEVQVFLNPELREQSKKKIVKKIMVKEEIMKIIRERIIKQHKKSFKEL